MSNKYKYYDTIENVMHGPISVGSAHKTGIHDLLLMFTGKLDFTGEEIYEGDILLCMGNNKIYGEVVFEDGSYKYINRGTGYNDNAKDTTSYIGTVRIVGNIWSNNTLSPLNKF